MYSLNCILTSSGRFVGGRRLAAIRTAHFLPVLLVIIFHPCASSLAWGQAFVNGSIVGVVSDNSGGVIPQVNMTLTNLGTNTSSTTITDATGFYQFLDLPP